MAKMFRITDEDGNDMEDCLRHYFSKALTDRFPESSESIRDRICSTMLLRRKRILYRRDRYTSRPAVLPLPTFKPAIQVQPTAGRKQPERSGMLEQHQKESPPAVTPSVVPSVVQSATTLALRDFHRAAAPSVVSHTKTVDLGAHEDLIFPPIPHALGPSMIEVTCPYCLFSLPALDFSTQERWMLVHHFLYGFCEQQTDFSRTGSMFLEI